MDGHGGLQLFFKKPTSPEELDVKSLSRTNSITRPPNYGGLARSSGKGAAPERMKILGGDLGSNHRVGRREENRGLPRPSLPEGEIEGRVRQVREMVHVHEMRFHVEHRHDVSHEGEVARGHVVEGEDKHVVLGEVLGRWGRHVPDDEGRAVLDHVLVFRVQMVVLLVGTVLHELRPVRFRVEGLGFRVEGSGFRVWG